MPWFNGPLFEQHGRGGKGFGFGFGFGFFGADASKLADFLGISQDQLKTELRADNATLASVAQAHGKSRDDLKNFLTTQMKTRLGQAVTAGRLTQAQADQRLAAFTANLDKMIDRTGKGGPGPARQRGASL